MSAVGLLHRTASAAWFYGAVQALCDDARLLQDENDLMPLMHLMHAMHVMDTSDAAARYIKLGCELDAGDF